MNSRLKQPLYEAPKKRPALPLPRNIFAVGIALVFGAVLILASGQDGLAQSVSDKPVEASTDSHGTWVRFHLHDDHARSVQLAGSFSQWEPRYTLRRGGHGNWTVIVQLKPGRYEYLFVVDGRRWIADPAARSIQGDGFGGRNSVIVITAGGKKGGIHVENG